MKKCNVLSCFFTATSDDLSKSLTHINRGGVQIEKEVIKRRIEFIFSLNEETKMLKKGRTV